MLQSSSDSVYHPTVLHISLDRTGAPSGGTCSFKIHTIEHTITSVTVACSEMGVLATHSQLQTPNAPGYNYRIPASCLQQLESDIAENLHEDLPLWLQFSSDCGNLALVPWELLLHSIVHTPILRMPYYDFKPFAAPSSCLDIVLCASRWMSTMTPPIEMQLNWLARSLLDTLQATSDERTLVVIHIFSDRFTYQHLQQLLADRLASPDHSGVRLYNPEDSVSQEGDCPWLRWILSAFQDRSADAVHFLCRGSLSSAQGSMLLAGTPDSAQSNWSIGAQQLNTFSTRIGAWSIGFSTSEPDACASGLRLLIDQLARLRPGPVLLYEGETDPGDQTLASLYHFLCNDIPGILPTSPTLALYCHPSRIQHESQYSQQQVHALHQYTLAKGIPLEIMQSAENTPGWIASTQRYLEQATAQLLHTPNTPCPKKSTQLGIEQALSFLSTILTQHTTAQIEEDKEQSSREDL